MKLNMQNIQEKIQPVVNQISDNRYLKAVMGGMMAALPATIIGSLATLIKSIPITPYQNFLTTTGLGTVLQIPVTFTTNILALIFVVCIAYSLAESFEVKGVTPAILAMISFFIITPIQSSTNDWGMTVGVIPMDWLGSTGVFSALIVAFGTARLYVYIIKKGWTIKMPDSVPPFIKDSFASLIPGILITTIFLVIASIFSMTPYGSVHQFIYSILQVPLTNLGGSIGAMLLVAFISQILWLVGIHGSMVTLSIMLPIWMSMDAAQLSAYSAGEALPYNIGWMFFNAYTFSGTAVGLAVVMLRAKSKRFQTLGKLSIVPAFFGITEPLIFGTPLVLNPKFAIPFVFGNIFSLLFAYIATITNIIPPLTGIGAPAGTPVILQALIAGGWKNAVFQFILLLFWIALWYPSFKMEDKKACIEEANEA